MEQASTTNIHSAPDDFQVIDMGEDEYDPPTILGRPFLNTIKPSSILEPEKSTCTSPLKKATQPKPEEANHQGRMGRLRRRSGKV